MSEARTKQLESELHELGHLGSEAVDNEDMVTTLLITNAIQQRLRELLDMGAQTSPGGQSLQELYDEGNRLLTKWGPDMNARH